MPKKCFPQIFWSVFFLAAAISVAFSQGAEAPAALVLNRPVVRYLDIAYDNAAKARDGKTTIGQMDEKLKPNTFVKLSAPFEPGTIVAVQDGAEQKSAQVIRVAGEKVFVNGFAGRVAVVDKSRCTPFPLVSAAKPGDKVKAVWVGSLKEGTVTRGEAGIGRVFIKFDVDGREKAVSFGEIMK